MAQQFIYQMQGLTKAYPGGKKVFENIWLSFYGDAAHAYINSTDNSARFSLTVYEPDVGTAH